MFGLVLLCLFGAVLLFFIFMRLVLRCIEETSWDRECKREIKEILFEVAHYSESDSFDVLDLAHLFAKLEKYHLKTPVSDGLKSEYIALEKQVINALKNLSLRYEWWIKNNKLTEKNMDSINLVIEDLNKSIRVNEQDCNNEIYGNNAMLTRYLDPIYSSFTDVTNVHLSDIFDKYGINNYSFVDVSRSTVAGVEVGRYIYTIDEKHNLHLLRIPVLTFNKYAILDPNYSISIQTIMTSSIKDYQIFGSEMMQSTVSGSGGGSIDSGVSMGKTILTEAIFGTAAALKQAFPTINPISIQTSHEVKDTRVIQVVLNDHTDIEFKGIQIFYDFNRYYGAAKNKEDSIARFNNASNLDKIEKKETLALSENNVVEQIKELKALMNEGVITEAEYAELKRKMIY